MVDELVLSQQKQPHIYRSIQQLAEAGVTRIILNDDLGFKCFKGRLLKN